MPTRRPLWRQIVVVLALLAGATRFWGSDACRSHSIKATGKAKAAPLDLGAEVTYGDTNCNRFLYGCNSSGFSDVHLNMGSTLGVGKSWTFTPSIQYSTLLNHNMLRGQDRRSNVWVNLSLGTKF